MIVKLDCCNDVESLVAKAFLRTFKQSANYFCNQTRRLRSAYCNLDETDVYSTICMQYDHNHLQYYYGRNVVNDVVTIRSSSVKGYNLPIACSFTQDGVVTIRSHEHSNNSDDCSICRRFVTNFMQLADEHNIKYNIMSE